MSALDELSALLQSLNIPVETGKFSDTAPKEYAVLTPLSDSFLLFANDRPEYETQEVRLSLFTTGSYTALKSKVVNALFSANFTITERNYIGHEDDTNYHNYAIDVAKLYQIQIIEEE